MDQATSINSHMEVFVEYYHLIIKKQIMTYLEDPSRRKHIKNVLVSVRPPKTLVNLIGVPAEEYGLEKILSLRAKSIVD